MLRILQFFIEKRFDGFFEIPIGDGEDRKPTETNGIGDSANPRGTTSNHPTRSAAPSFNERAFRMPNPARPRVRSSAVAGSGADRNFKGPFYTLGHVRKRLKERHEGSRERAGVHRRAVSLTRRLRPGLTVFWPAEAVRIHQNPIGGRMNLRTPGPGHLKGSHLGDPLGVLRGEVRAFGRILVGRYRAPPRTPRTGVAKRPPPTSRGIDKRPPH